MTPSHERIEWLACLISEFTRLYEATQAVGEEDEDPSATWEMLAQCSALLAMLRASAQPEPLPEPPAAPDPEMPF